MNAIDLLILNSFFRGIIQKSCCVIIYLEFTVRKVRKISTASDQYFLIYVKKLQGAGDPPPHYPLFFDFLSKFQKGIVHVLDRSILVDFSCKLMPLT